MLLRFLALHWQFGLNLCGKAVVMTAVSLQRKGRLLPLEGGMLGLQLHLSLFY